MIGAGTGVAPYRAFLQEREVRGAAGKSWLFFGERNFRSDFLYQTEWQDWLQDGTLGRMDVAFSRDGSEKIYVQHRMKEHSRDIYENGRAPVCTPVTNAHLVCRLPLEKTHLTCLLFTHSDPTGRTHRSNPDNNTEH